jgi:hypothetical protein
MVLLELLDKRIILRDSKTTFQPHQFYLTGKILNLHFMTLENASSDSDLKLYLMVHGLSLADNQCSVTVPDEHQRLFLNGEEAEIKIGSNQFRIKLI